MMSNVVNLMPYIEKQKALSRYEFQNESIVGFISLMCRMSIEYLTNKIQQGLNLIQFIQRTLKSIENVIFGDKKFVKSFVLMYDVNNLLKRRWKNSSLEKSLKS